METIFTKVFSNLEGFRRYLDNAKFNELFKDENDRSSRTGRAYFTGTADYDTADGLLRDGDTENAKKLTAASGAGLKSANGDGQRARRVSAVCGGAANVPAVLMGLPKSMIMQKKFVYKDSKVLNLVYSVSIGANIDADEINRVSVNLVNAIMGIEKSGYRVNLYVCVCAERKYTRRGSEYCNMFVRIKDSGQYMDVKKMAYPLVNPSMLRRHYFRFVETAENIKDSSWVHTYGTPIKDVLKIQEFAKNAGINAKKAVTFYDVREKSAPDIMRLLLS